MLGQLMIVVLIAACVAGQLNRGIYGLAWNQRPISPWGPAPQGAETRRWADCLPIYGWFRMRREANWHGAYFWVRPALIELAFALGCGALYWFEMNGGLLPVGASPQPPDVRLAQFFNHACLIALMTVATFIDLDEKTIPDEITVPGTLLAVVLAATWPQVALPTWIPSAEPSSIEPLHLATPAAWSAAFDGPRGLAIAVGSLVGWWYALLPKTLWYRGGIRKFLRFWWASLQRHRFSPRLSCLVLLALAGTTWAWWLGGTTWRAVLSAWVGMAVGGAIVWVVRIVASAALGQEAMGFGDVTLMGMIGAFLGWQPALVVFFLAPFTGVLIAVAQWLLSGRKDIAYGPFLCLAALLVIVGWADVWTGWGFPVFSLGGLVPAVLVFSLLLLGASLAVIQWLKSLAAGRSS